MPDRPPGNHKIDCWRFRAIRRLHLFEFEDQNWFPHSLRRAMQSYLATMYRTTPLPKLWAGAMAPLMEPSGRVNEIVDLASGAGGPLPAVLRELDALGVRASITLTDRFPNPRSTELTYWPEPVDARHPPAALAGIRTMFASFHHFRPEDARGILRDAFERRRPICIFEATAHRGAATAVLIPLLVILLTPTVRPLSWTQILFTYLVPILPFLIFWDGLVSHLRTYSVAEFDELISSLQSPGYEWQSGEFSPRGVPFRVPYLIGRPL